MLFSKNFRVLSIFALIAAAPHAVLAATPAGDSTITSKRYVDNKIPADSTAHLLVTPQASGGNATKRAITTAGTGITGLETSSSSGATNIPTAYAVKEAITTATNAAVPTKLSQLTDDIDAANVLNSVKMDGTALTVTDKAVNIPTMGAASSSAAGSVGLVPAPGAGAQAKVLSGAKTWVVNSTTAVTNSDGSTVATSTSANDGSIKVTKDGTTTYPVVRGWSTKENTSNKLAQGSATTSVIADNATNDTKFPTVKAVADYVTGQGYITNAAIPTALSAFTDDIDAANTINTVKANGTALTVTDKAVNIPNMTGATASAAGKDGLVPAPSAGAQTKYLRGDGTWAGEFTGATSSAAGTAGLVKKPAAGDQAKYLRGDGTWAGEFTGATSSANGTAGLVKQPLKANRTQFLKGDGTWATPDNSVTTVKNSDGTDGASTAADGSVQVTKDGTTTYPVVQGWASKQTKPSSVSNGKVLAYTGTDANANVTATYIQVPVATGDPNNGGTLNSTTPLASIWVE